MDRVIWESRHKFVYYDDIDELKKVCSQYHAKLDSDEPIVVYVKDEGLPDPSDISLLNKDIVKSFHSSYYQLLIFLSIIEEIISSLDNDDLNKKLVRLFKVVSYCGTSKIDDLDTLIKMLRDSIKKYRDIYIQYITTGSYQPFYNDLPIQFILIDNLLPLFKESIGLKKYFCLMMEFDSEVSKYNSMAINDYIASRCNDYLTMNVLLPSDKCWKCYYANNSQYIEWCHDYTDVDLRNSKKRIRQN